MDTSNVDRVRVHLAVNDWRNGNPTYYVRTVQIGDGEMLQLDGGRPIVCRRTGKRYLRFGRMTLNILGYSTWVGNWCWDCALVGMGDAVRIVNYCQKAGWSISAGETSLFDKYESGQAITADDLRMALLEVEA